MASQNEARVLRALNRFGWLPTKSLGALLWQPWLRKPASEPDMQPRMPAPSARLMAQHTLRRLYLARQVLRARAPDNSLIYTLAEAGVRWLAQQLGMPAVSGKDWVRRFSSAQFRHRSIANDIAIAGIVFLLCIFPVAKFSEILFSCPENHFLAIVFFQASHPGTAAASSRCLRASSLKKRA